MFDEAEGQELFRVWGDMVAGAARRQHDALEHDLMRALWGTKPERWGHLVIIERDGIDVPPTVASTWPEPLTATAVEP